MLNLIIWLQNVKVNKEEEDAKLANLLNDDFMVDEDEEYDPNTLIQPLTLPKSKMGKTFHFFASNF